METNNPFLLLAIIIPIGNCVVVHDLTLSDSAVISSPLALNEKTPVNIVDPDFDPAKLLFPVLVAFIFSFWLLNLQAVKSVRIKIRILKYFIWMFFLD